MTTVKPHPHAAMITEWVKDTSRIVQIRLDDESWEDCSSLPWFPPSQFRFADSVKPTIRSSLSDEELRIIWNRADTIPIACRAMADVAAARAIKDLPKLEVRIGGGELCRMYRDFDSDTSDSLMAVAKAVVADCNEQLRKPK